MGTKNSPSIYDCLEKAGPDEPLFILLARDPCAAPLVKAWAHLRNRDFKKAMQALIDADDAVHEQNKQTSDEKIKEALKVANDMAAFKRARDFHTYKKDVKEGRA